MTAGRNLKWVFGISLFLNLLLAGVVIGHIWWHASHWNHDVGLAADKLPADKRAVFVSAMKNLNNQIRPLRDQIRTAHEKADKILSTDPFDKDAYLTQAKQIDTLHSQIAADVNAQIANLGGQMTPDERHALMQAMRPPGPPPHE